MTPLFWGSLVNILVMYLTFGLGGYMVGTLIFMAANGASCLCQHSQR